MSFKYFSSEENKNIIVTEPGNYIVFETDRGESGCISIDPKIIPSEGLTMDTAQSILEKSGIWEYDDQYGFCEAKVKEIYTINNFYFITTFIFLMTIMSLYPNTFYFMPFT